MTGDLTNIVADGETVSTGTTADNAIPQKTTEPAPKTQKQKEKKSSKSKERRDSRTEAFVLVFEKCFKSQPILDIMDTDPERKKPDEYMVAVLELLEEKSAEIDTIISKRSKKWEISRLSRITLSALRLALAELIVGKEPTAVIINEAVELAKMYGSSEDASYINGILGGYVREWTNEEQKSDT